MGIRQAWASLGVLLVMAGCTAAPAEPEVVDVWFHSAQGVERDVLSEQIASFNRDHEEVQVRLDFVPEDQYDERVQVAARSGGLPCLLDVDGPVLASYAAEGHLLPLDAHLAPEVRDDLLASVRAQGTWEGTTYGVGTFDSGLALWGNREYLDAAGVRIPAGVGDAWDFAEFEAALAALQALPAVEHAIDFKLDYGVGEWFTYGLGPIVEGFGGGLVDGETMRAGGTLDSPASVAGLEWFAGLLADGRTTVAATEDTFEGSRTTALSWVGHWMWSPYSQGLGDDLVLLPIPVLPARHVTGLGSWQWGISAGCDAPDAAAQFLDHLLQPREILRMTAANGAVPARRSAIAESPEYGPGGPLRIFAEQLEAGIAVARPATPQYPAITTAFSAAVQEVIDGRPVDQALTQAASRIDRAMEDAGASPPG